MQSTDNDFLRKYLDDMKNSIVVHLISYFLVLTVSVFPVHIQAMQDLIPNIEIQAKFHNQIVIGVKVIRWSYCLVIDFQDVPLYVMIINIIFALMSFSIFIYCVLSVLKTLRIHKTTLTVKTYKLFRGLINAIVFDIALIVVFVTWPLSVIAATAVFFPQYSLLISTVVVVFLALLPMATEIVLILCIPPYFR
jgi:hypothetical protein